MLRLLLILWLFCAAFVLSANELINNSLQKQPVVSEIEIKGLTRTQPSVIHRELLFEVNDTLTTEELINSIQNLKNLEIFSSVIPLLELQENNWVKVTIKISEKWTTIPYLNFSFGGGTRYIYSGIYDINVFGKFIELGTQYNNWNDEHGVLAWYINQRLFNQKMTLQLVTGSTLRPRTLYATNGEKEANYVLSRNELGVSLIKELQPWLKVGAAMELENDEIIHSEYEPTLNDAHKSQLINTERSKNSFLSFILKLGKLNHHNYLVEGKHSSVIVKHGGSHTNSDTSINMFRWENKAFWLLPHYANLAMRFTLAQTDAKTIQHQFYVGGFEHIRGYLDGQLRSRAYWQINSEYRIPSYQSSWLVLQHIFFIDATQVADKVSEFDSNESTYLSAGIGFRIISPKIYRFNGRLDIALLTSGNSTSLISLGAQQFF